MNLRGVHFKTSLVMGSICHQFLQYVTDSPCETVATVRIGLKTQLEREFQTELFIGVSIAQRSTRQAHLDALGQYLASNGSSSMLHQSLVMEYNNNQYFTNTK